MVKIQNFFTTKTSENLHPCAVCCMLEFLHNILVLLDDVSFQWRLDHYRWMKSELQAQFGKYAESE